MISLDDLIQYEADKMTIISSHIKWQETRLKYLNGIEKASGIEAMQIASVEAGLFFLQEELRKAARRLERLRQRKKFL